MFLYVEHMHVPIAVSFGNSSHDALGNRYYSFSKCIKVKVLFTIGLPVWIWSIQQKLLLLRKLHHTTYWKKPMLIVNNKRSWKNLRILFRFNYVNHVCVCVCVCVCACVCVCVCLRICNIGIPACYKISCPIWWEV